MTTTGPFTTAIAALLIFGISACETVPNRHKYTSVSGDEAVRQLKTELQGARYTVVGDRRYRNYQITARSAATPKEFIFGSASEYQEVTVNVRAYETEPPVVEVWGDVKTIVRSPDGAEDIRSATPKERKKVSELIRRLGDLLRQNGGR